MTLPVIKNVRMAVTDDKILVINIDLNKELGLTAAGRSILVGTTSGLVPVPGTPEYRVGVNVIKLIKKGDKNG